MESVGVSLRLNKDVWERFSAEAQARALPLATLLRDHLENQDRLQVELGEIRRAIQLVAATPAPPATGTGAEESPAMRAGILELLLLLRSVAGPQRAMVSQKEVERRGLEPWR